MFPFVPEPETFVIIMKVEMSFRILKSLHLTEGKWNASEISMIAAEAPSDDFLKKK